MLGPHGTNKGTLQTEGYESSLWFQCFLGSFSLQHKSRTVTGVLFSLQLIK